MQQEEELETHYGLVLALQVNVPDASLDLVQSSAPDEPEDPADILAGLFRVSFSDVQTTLAIDEDVRDMRQVSLVHILHKNLLCSLPSI